MTDGGAPPAGSQDDAMLTTGEAAELIGFGTTRKQVITMIATGRIAYVRPARGQWARIPVWAALAKREELERALAESEEAARRNAARIQAEREHEDH
jgi:hypothetical protein